MRELDPEIQEVLEDQAEVLEEQQMTKMSLF